MKILYKVVHLDSQRPDVEKLLQKFCSILNRMRVEQRDITEMLEAFFLTVVVTRQSLVIEGVWKPHGCDVREGPRVRNKTAPK